MNDNKKIPPTLIIVLLIVLTVVVCVAIVVLLSKLGGGIKIPDIIDRSYNKGMITNPILQSLI